MTIIRGNEQWQGVDEDIRRMEQGQPPVGGWDEWAKHQRPVSPERERQIDDALGIRRGTDWKVIGKSEDGTGS